MSETQRKIQEFKRGNKQDKVNYPQLKNDNYYVDFRYKFIAQATADGCEQVLDRSYTPENAEELELDLEMNKFIYLVLLHCFQTGKSKQLVRINYESQDARKVFFEYSDYYCWV